MADLSKQSSKPYCCSSGRMVKKDKIKKELDAAGSKQNSSSFPYRSGTKLAKAASALHDLIFSRKN